MGGRWVIVGSSRIGGCGGGRGVRSGLAGAASSVPLRRRGSGTTVRCRAGDLGVLLAALLAFAARWLLEGGIRKRERARIREEIEIAEMLPDAWSEQRLELFGSAHGRLAAYLAPRWWYRESKVWDLLTGLAMIFIGVTTLVTTLVFIQIEENGPVRIGLSLLFGGTAVGTIVALESVNRDRRIRRAIDAQRKEGDE